MRGKGERAQRGGGETEEEQRAGRGTDGEGGTCGDAGRGQRRWKRNEKKKREMRQGERINHRKSEAKFSNKKNKQDDRKKSK